MKIMTTELESFLTNLRSAQVYRNVVYYERTKHPLNGRTSRDATSWSVYFQLSAVQEFENGGQALLVCGIDCGVDRHSGDGGVDGTRQLEKYKNELERFCEDNRLDLLPGVLDQ